MMRTMLRHHHATIIHRVVYQQPRRSINLWGWLQNTWAPRVHQDQLKALTLSSGPESSAAAEVLQQEEMKEPRWIPEPIDFQVGRIARLASGSVFACHGDAVVLATAVQNTQSSDAGLDFLPLAVEYREKFYAAGKIPRSIQRRENQTDEEILRARILDRSIRPLFPPSYRNDTQVITTLQSHDPKKDAVVLAVNAASAALHISDIPWQGPVGCCRIGEIDGKLVVNPSQEQLARSSLDLVYTGTSERVLMIEASGAEIPNRRMRQALALAQESIQHVISDIQDLHKRVGKSKSENVASVDENSTSLAEYAMSIGYEEAKALFRTGDVHKEARVRRERLFASELRAKLQLAYPSVSSSDLESGLHDVLTRAIRHVLLVERERFDGRPLDAIRPLELDVQMLPGAHGSAVFARGDTQTLCTATLSTLEDARPLYSATSSSSVVPKRAFLHYEFPPYCVNETGRVGGVNRRMVGHGALAEKAILPLLPSEEDFPFAIRMTSEVTMSDGSSSMATVCGVSLALLDAGVPLKRPVAGLSIGLVSGLDSDDSSTTQYQLLTDILGTEDHFGDMDFKIAGTSEGITAIQLDVKLPEGIPLDIINASLDRAKDGRMQILGQMNATLDGPRTSKNPDLKTTTTSGKTSTTHNIPEYTTLRLPFWKRGKIIGRKGSQIRAIEEAGNTRIRMTDDPENATQFQVSIYGTPANIAKTERLIHDVTFVQNQWYDVEIVRVESTGLHVVRSNASNISAQGFVPVSEVDLGTNETIQTSFKVGQVIPVECIDDEASKCSMHNTSQLLTIGQKYHLRVEKVFDFGIGLIGPDGRTPVFLHQSEMLPHELGEKKGMYVYSKGDCVSVRCLNAKRKLMSTKMKHTDSSVSQFQQVVVVNDTAQVEALLDAQHARLQAIAQDTNTVIFRQDEVTFCVKGKSTLDIDRAVDQIQQQA